MTDRAGTDQTAEPQAAASGSRPRLRRYAPDGVIVVAGVIVAMLAAWLLVPYLSFPSSRLVGWELVQTVGPGDGQFDPTTDQTATVISVGLEGLVPSRSS